MVASRRTVFSHSSKKQGRVKQTLNPLGSFALPNPGRWTRFIFFGFLFFFFFFFSLFLSFLVDLSPPSALNRLPNLFLYHFRRRIRLPPLVVCFRLYVWTVIQFIPHPPLDYVSFPHLSPQLVEKACPKDDSLLVTLSGKHPRFRFSFPSLLPFSLIHRDSFTILSFLNRVR